MVNIQVLPHIELIDPIKSLIVPFGTKENELDLPKEITLVLSDQTKVTTSVKWSLSEDNNFDGKVPGKYTFIGNYDLPENIQGDKLEVTVSVTVLNEIVEEPTEGDGEPEEDVKPEGDGEPKGDGKPKGDGEPEADAKSEADGKPEEKTKETTVPEQSKEQVISKDLDERENLKEDKQKASSAGNEVARDKKQEKLPSTSTNNYTILLVGFIILVLGAMLLIRVRKTN